MANYSVDIEVGLKGTEKLRELRSNIDALTTKIETINRYADVFKAPLQSVHNYNKALRDASDALKKAELGTKDESDAIKMYVQALGNAEGAQKRRIRLIEQEIQAQKRLQVQQTSSSKTIELGPGGPGFSGGFTPADRARANQVARERENSSRRQTLELLNREVLFEIRLQKIRERNTALQRTQAGRTGAVSNAVIGGAFPLLFGQGPGAALGGALGGGIGGRLGGQAGFGGSLVGTIVGQATIDFAINSVVQLGNALKKPTENIQELTKFLSIAGTETNTTIDVLRGLGLESAAASVALQELERRLGEQGFKDAKSISKDLQEFDNTLRDLRLSAALLGTKFKPLLDFITEVVRLASKAGLPKGGTLATVANVATVATSSGTSTKTAAARQDTTAATNATIENVINRRVALVASEVALERERLSLGRVSLASRQGELQIQRISVDLEEKKLNALKEQDPAKRKLLDLEVKITEQQRAQIELARRNAIIEAERQVQRDLTAQYNQQIGAQLNINNLRADGVELTQGELAGIKAKQDLLESEDIARKGILFNERTLALLGVNELNVREEIIKTYDGLATLLTAEISNRRTALTQQEAQYNLTQLQIKQQRELNNIQAEGQMALEVASLRAAVDPKFFGVFGGSARTQELMISELQTRLGEMRIQQINLAQQLETPGLSPQRIQELEQQSLALENQVAIYEKYQPAVINAAVAQQRFNEALALTTPVVDSVFNSFMAVAEGTATAQQAFADFLRGIANMLFDVAKQLIAQYIAIGIARQFAGIPGAGGGLEARTATGNAAFMQRTGGLDLAGSLYTRASGGPVSAGTPYLVGERGPELFMPRTSGSIYPNDAMGMGGSNIVVNVDATGSSVGGDPGQASQLGKVIGLAVQQELVKQKRPGGLLA